MKRTYGLIGIGLLIIVVLLLIKPLAFNQNAEPSKIPVTQTPTPALTVEKNVDYEARFTIYTNGTKRIFTNSMYHNLSKDVYIEASDPSIVHVKKDGVAWMDFFGTLPFKLSKDCLTTGTNETFCSTKNATLKFYLNGIKSNNLLMEKIKDGDWALISYGTENEAQIKSQLNFPKPSDE